MVQASARRGTELPFGRPYLPLLPGNVADGDHSCRSSSDQV